MNLRDIRRYNALWQVWRFTEAAQISYAHRRVTVKVFLEIDQQIWELKFISDEMKKYGFQISFIYILNMHIYQSWKDGKSNEINLFNHFLRIIKIRRNFGVTRDE